MNRTWKLFFLDGTTETVETFSLFLAWFKGKLRAAEKGTILMNVVEAAKLEHFLSLLTEVPSVSTIPSTAHAIRSGGINWCWYQIEDGEDAVTFRLHRESNAVEIEKLERDFQGRIVDGENRPVRWETFPKWGLNGKFSWVFERYNLCDDCVTAAVVTGKPMREPRKLTREEEKEREERSKSLIEKIHREKVEEILGGRRWILINSGIPMAQVTEEEKKMIDKEIIKEFGQMPPHLEWRKIEVHE